MGKNPGLGIGLSVLGSLCTALGYTFQKLAHRRADASAEAAAREAARSGERAGPSGLSEDVSTVEGEVTQRSVPKAPRGTPYYRFWQFPAGLAMLILGSVVGVVTFGLAGQAELAPMSAVTLVWNELLSWRVSAAAVCVQTNLMLLRSAAPARCVNRLLRHSCPFPCWSHLVCRSCGSASLASMPFPWP